MPSQLPTVDSARQEIANRQATQLENVKTAKQLPYAERDILSQITSRESSARYNNAAARRSDATLDADVAIKEANAKMKTQEWVEMMKNSDLRMAHEKATLVRETFENESWNEMYRDNPDKYKAILTTQVEAEGMEGRLNLLKNKREAKYEMLNTVISAYEGGGAKAANERAAEVAQEWQESFGTPFPYQAVNEQTIKQMSKHQRGLTYGLEHLQQMEQSQANQAASITAGERDRMRYLQLEQKKQTGELSPIEESEHEFLSRKYLGSRFRGIPKTDDEGYFFMPDQDTGEPVYMKDEDGNKIKDPQLALRRQQEERLVGAEQRRVWAEMDDSYKDFAKEHRGFLDQMDIINRSMEDPETYEESTIDNAIVMAYIRQVKPTGTISSNFDIDRIDSLQGVPQRIKAAVKSLWAGKNIETGTRTALVNFLKEREAQASARERAIISRNNKMASDMGVEWAPPVESDLYKLSVDKIESMSKRELDLTDPSQLTLEQKKALLNRYKELEE